MSKTFESQQAMLKSTLSVLVANKTQTDKIPVMGEFITELDGIVRTFEKQRQEYRAARRGSAKNLDTAATELIAGLEPVRASVQSLASRANNSGLRDQMMYTTSDFLRMRKETLLEAASTILNLATENKTELVRFGGSEDVMSALAILVENYSTALKASGTNKAARKAYQKQFSELTGTSNHLLKEHLDNLMEHFKASDPFFYNAYQKARVKFIGGIRHKQQPVATDVQTVTTTPAQPPAS
jgi:hypothetical protein